MKNVTIQKCIYALVGIFLVGVGVSFNALAGLGNDPVAIFYDGIRNLLNMSYEQFGLASNLVNYALIIILFFIARRYISIGTIIYILPYGTFVDIGTLLYEKVFASQTLTSTIIACIIGTILIYIGVAIFIVMDMGLDPMTASAKLLGDKLKWDFREAKILFDIFLIAIGFLLGGKLGIVTIITACTAGPLIQSFSTKLRKKLKY